MIITRAGSQPGTVAISLPESMKGIAEQITDHVCDLYPRVTVRIVVNHCLQPEIIRADRIDDSKLRDLIGQLRQGQLPTDPLTVQWYQRITQCLGGTIEDTMKFSFRALHEKVRAKDHKFAAALDRWLAGSGGANPLCIHCSLEVAPTDFVQGPAHRACVEKETAQASLAFAGDNGIALLTKAAFIAYPQIAHAYVLAGMSDDALRALVFLVLS